MLTNETLTELGREQTPRPSIVIVCGGFGNAFGMRFYADYLEPLLHLPHWCVLGHDSCDDNDRAMHKGVIDRYLYTQYKHYGRHAVEQLVESPAFGVNPFDISKKYYRMEKMSTLSSMGRVGAMKAPRRTLCLMAQNAEEVDTVVDKVISIANDPSNGVNTSAMTIHIIAGYGGFGIGSGIYTALLTWMRHIDPDSHGENSHMIQFHTFSPDLYKLDGKQGERDRCEGIFASMTQHQELFFGTGTEHVDERLKGLLPGLDAFARRDSDGPVPLPSDIVMFNTVTQKHSPFGPIDVDTAWDSLGLYLATTIQAPAVSAIVQHVVEEANDNAKDHPDPRGASPIGGGIIALGCELPTNLNATGAALQQELVLEMMLKGSGTFQGPDFGIDTDVLTRVSGWRNLLQARRGDNWYTLGDETQLADDLADWQEFRATMAEIRNECGGLIATEMDSAIPITDVRQVFDSVAEELEAKVHALHRTAPNLTETSAWLSEFEEELLRRITGVTNRPLLETNVQAFMDELKREEDTMQVHYEHAENIRNGIVGNATTSQLREAEAQQYIDTHVLPLARPCARRSCTEAQNWVQALISDRLIIGRDILLRKVRDLIKETDALVREVSQQLPLLRRNTVDLFNAGRRKSAVRQIVNVDLSEIKDNITISHDMAAESFTWWQDGKLNDFQEIEKISLVESLVRPVEVTIDPVDAFMNDRKGLTQVSDWTDTNNNCFFPLINVSIDQMKNFRLQTHRIAVCPPRMEDYAKGLDQVDQVVLAKAIPGIRLIAIVFAIPLRVFGGLASAEAKLANSDDRMFQLVSYTGRGEFMLPLTIDPNSFMCKVLVAKLLRHDEIGTSLVVSGLRIIGDEDAPLNPLLTQYEGGEYGVRVLSPKRGTGIHLLETTDLKAACAIMSRHYGCRESVTKYITTRINEWGVHSVQNLIDNAITELEEWLFRMEHRTPKADNVKIMDARVRTKDDGTTVATNADDPAAIKHLRADVDEDDWLRQSDPITVKSEDHQMYIEVRPIVEFIYSVLAPIKGDSAFYSQFGRVLEMRQQSRRISAHVSRA